MPASNLPLPAAPGAYALLIELENPEAIEVGRLGAINFPAGWYAYVGSALGGLRARVGRHLRRNKKLHWHVDYLLKVACLSEVIWTLSNERLECRIANVLQRQGFESMPNFGSSDCRCPSHLFFADSLESLRTGLVRAFESVEADAQLTLIARCAIIRT